MELDGQVYIGQGLKTIIRDETRKLGLSSLDYPGFVKEMNKWPYTNKRFLIVREPRKVSVGRSRYRSALRFRTEGRLRSRSTSVVEVATPTFRLQDVPMYTPQVGGIATWANLEAAMQQQQQRVTRLQRETPIADQEYRPTPPRPLRDDEL